MEFYQALEMVSISGGNVTIDSKQFRRRRHSLKDNGNGTFSVIAPIQFKKGERFGSDYAVNKGLIQTLSVIDVQYEDAYIANEPQNVLADAVILEDAPVEDAPVEDAEDEPAQTENVVDSYEQFSKATLRRELEHRGVDYKQTDSKATLIILLEDDDVINSAPE